MGFRESAERSRAILPVTFLSSSNSRSNRNRARRLASTITHNADKRLRDIALVDVEVTEIKNAVAEFKAQVAGGASVGQMPGRLIKG
jgi:hypothetical protein